MHLPAASLEIQTLGRFRITIAGKQVLTDWPDESLKILFCSLLSPLDQYVSWDWLCRSLLGQPDTLTSRRRLEKTFIQPLISLMNKEFGFNPLISGEDGTGINRQHIHVDAVDFNSTVIEGFRLLSLGNHDEAHEKFIRAKSVYAGSYLPGMTNKIIDITCNELESLYRTAVMDAMPLARNPVCWGRNRRTEPGRNLTAY